MSDLARWHGHWISPITRSDFLSLPGVVDVREEDEPMVITLVVQEGCEGVARILKNSGVLSLNLIVHEEVQEGMPEP